MPRGFSPGERIRIEKDLVQAAGDLVVQKGFRGTSIDQIVQTVRIAKGSFYKFFGSKEELIYEAVRQVQTQARSQLREAVANASQDSARNQLQSVIRSLFHILEANPLLREISTTQIMADLLRGLPEATIREERVSDDKFFDELFDELRERQVIEEPRRQVFGGIPRLVLAMVLQKEMLGLPQYEDLKEVLGSALAAELAPQSPRRS
jgi:AcrR family transcriptional regulator